MTKDHVQKQKNDTLLVNIWLNHLVMDAGLLDDDVCSALTKPWEDNKSNLKGDNDYASPFIWNHNVNLTKPTKTEQKNKTCSVKCRSSQRG